MPPLFLNKSATFLTGASNLSSTYLCACFQDPLDLACSRDAFSCLPTLEQLNQSQTTSRAISASDIYRDEPTLQGAGGGLSGSMAVSYFTECKPLHLNRNALHFGKMQRPLLLLFNKF